MNCNTTHYRANSSSVPGDPTNSATARTHGLLVLALILEGLLQASRFWLALGPVPVPAGAGILGWLLVTWIDRQRERPGILPVALALLAGGVLLGVLGSAMSQDVMKSTDRPLRFALPFEMLAYFVPFLLTRQWNQESSLHCRFCSTEMASGARLLLVGASRARFLWRLISEADLAEIFEALRQESRSSSMDLTRLEVRFTYCTPCACGEITLVKHADGVPEEKAIAFRGPRHVRQLASLGVARPV